MGGAGLESLRRPLTARENELVRWLIDHGSSKDKALLKSQIEALSVWERCLCGCPSIYFAHQGVPVSRKGERLISDHLAFMGGDEFGVMLFETEGVLSSLEVYSCAGAQEPFGLPELTTIRGYDQPA